ncbi:MAG: hypothetical protein PVJ89_01175 [Planctomycetota bacterium]|jgi:hypothetical protein
MIQRISRYASSRWWAALAIGLAILTVARTNTVDAPADAMTLDAAAPDRSAGIAGIAAPSLELARSGQPGAEVQLDHVRYLWTLESEVRALESELAVERARAQLLQESYRALQDKFMRLSAALPLLTGSNPSPSIHVPVPAAATTAAGTSLGRNPR